METIILISNIKLKIAFVIFAQINYIFNVLVYKLIIIKMTLK
jgi:hypothetical protein